MALDQEDGPLVLLNLPEEILDNVLLCLTYEEISDVRLVCQTFNQKCHKLLNQGFTRVDRYHGQIQKTIKSQLPRRESERRNHPLARHVDILAAIETRLSLLNMTYMKYIDLGLCCFIPGKVLDEIFHVLTYIKNNPSPPRAHELLQELRDISSMAMEHFDEKIVPMLKRRMPPVQHSLNTSFPGFSSGSTFTTAASVQVTAALQQAQQRSPTLVQRQDLLQVRHSLRNTNSILTVLKKDLAETKVKVADQKRKVVDIEKKLLEQTRIIHEQSRKMSAQDKIVSDLNKKILGYDQKFEDIMTELARVRSGSEGFPEQSGLPLVPKTVTEKGQASLGKVRGEATKRKLETVQELVADRQHPPPTSTPYCKRLRSSRKAKI